MKNDKIFTKVYKYCKECHKTTTFIVEAMVSTCLKCHTAFEDDADELFGEIDEAVE